MADKALMLGGFGPILSREFSKPVLTWDFFLMVKANGCFWRFTDISRP